MGALQVHPAELSNLQGDSAHGYVLIGEKFEDRFDAARGVGVFDCRELGHLGEELRAPGRAIGAAVEIVDPEGGEGNDDGGHLEHSKELIEGSLGQDVSEPTEIPPHQPNRADAQLGHRHPKLFGSL